MLAILAKKEEEPILEGPILIACTIKGVPVLSIGIATCRQFTS